MNEYQIMRHEGTEGLLPDGRPGYIVLLRQTGERVAWFRTLTQAEKFVAYSMETRELAIADAFTPPDPFSRKA